MPTSQVYHAQCLKIHHTSTVDHQLGLPSLDRHGCELDQYQAVLDSEHTLLQFSRYLDYANV